MNVSFYGHVRQYHNIRAEIDANLHEVLESGQYVMGPMLARFEKEFAAYHGMKYAVGVPNTRTITCETIVVLTVTRIASLTIGFES